MSRIGKQPIILPEKVEIKVDGQQVFVKGPKGELSINLSKYVDLEIKDNQVITKVKDENNKSQRALWGTTRSLLQNLVIGVNEGYVKQLEINGVGFKAEMKGNILVLNVGYSHTVEYNVIDNIDINIEKNIITVSGIDKQKVGQVAAEIRAIKKPEPYKGKGIKYVEEIIRRKAGKVAKGVEK